MDIPELDPIVMTRLLIENEAEDLMDRAASGETTSVLILELGPDGLTYTSLLEQGVSEFEILGLLEQVKHDILTARSE